MQFAKNLGSETTIQVRRNNENTAQRRRSTFYETIKISSPAQEKKRKYFRNPQAGLVQNDEIIKGLQ